MGVFADDMPVPVKLDRWQVLEERQGIQLLQDLQSRRFYVRTATDGKFVCETPDWSQACRQWLKLQKQAIAKNVAVSATELHETFDRCQESPYFGRLIYNRDRHHSGLLQYGVQLDEYLAIQWSPIENHGVGQLQLETISWRRYRLSKWIEERSKADILAALHASVSVFHQQWGYDVCRFNSEHWSRLITLGEGLCYQTYEPAPSDAMPSNILEHNWDAQIALGIALAL
jgi:hypothetical protein